MKQQDWTRATDDVSIRLRDVARRANADGIDALVIVEPSSVYYLSGFRTTLHTRFTAVALRADDPETALLIVPSVDRKLALEPIWSPSRLNQTEIYYEGAAADGPHANDPRQLLDRVLRDGDTIGVDLADASYGHVRLIADQYPAATLADATEVLHAARRTKSESERAALAQANHIASEALATVSDVLRPGTTEIDLAAHLDRYVRERGADGFAYPTLIGFGPKSLAPHAPPTHNKLEPEQIVTVAFGPTVAGYCADIVRTYYAGTPPEAVRRASDHALEMQDAALGEIRAGARAGDLMNAASAALARHYPDAPRIGRAGHSIGLTVHETPSLTPDNDLILEPDMVLAIEPGGAPFAMDHIGLYRHCDVVRVTDDGCERLTTCARGLQVVPLT